MESLSIQCKEGQGVKDYKVHENKWHDRGAALIPNGDQGYEKTVSMITFVSALLFAMFLVKQLKKYDWLLDWLIE